LGLTIHYSLKSKTRSPTKARELVASLRRRALDLPFEQVGELIDLAGPECDYESCDQDDPHRWLLIQAGQYVARPAKGGGELHYSVAPTHVIAFETVPGPGCEPANFGLCRYPAFLEVKEDKRYVSEQGSVRPEHRIRTGLSGWRWSSFCKTQYASNPDCGGVPNFLRCHLAVIKLLDQARSLDLLENVSDEGDFWEHRDGAALAREVGEWNQMIAAFAGQVKDWFGDGVEAAITAFPDFEHLEAKGRAAQ
jgi:hypothetical protein